MMAARMPARQIGLPHSSDWILAQASCQSGRVNPGFATRQLRVIVTPGIQTPGSGMQHHGDLAGNNPNTRAICASNLFHHPDFQKWFDGAASFCPRSKALSLNTRDPARGERMLQLVCSVSFIFAPNPGPRPRHCPGSTPVSDSRTDSRTDPLVYTGGDGWNDGSAKKIPDRTSFRQGCGGQTHPAINIIPHATGRCPLSRSTPPPADGKPIPR